MESTVRLSVLLLSAFAVIDSRSIILTILRQDKSIASLTKDQKNASANYFSTFLCSGHRILSAFASIVATIMIQIQVCVCTQSAKAAQGSPLSIIAIVE